MRHFYNISCGVLLIIATMISTVSTGQLIVDDNITATQLANQIVGSGVTISNAQLRCGDGGAGLFSAGNTTNIGLSNGILLTSGNADDAGDSASGNTSVNQPSAYDGDSDLDNYTSFSIRDVCALTFDFEAESDFITVQYVFGSEEYNEYVCSEFNDIFGFFVSGPNPLGGSYNNVNVALVPSSTLPVTVNSINNGTPGSNGSLGGCLSLGNAAYYIDNTTGTSIMYDGFTVVLTAQIAIIPGETYTFKFAIADVSDSNLDSGVFIKANSFSIFLCQAGTISFGPNSGPTPYCLNDGFNDVISVVSNAVTPGENFEFLLTDNEGNILAINETGTFNMSSYGEGQFYAYSISYSGVVSGIEVGENVDDISANSLEGCFELSNSLLIQGNICEDLPELACPENLTLSCINDVPAPNASLVSLVSAECPGNITYAWVEDEVEGTDCNKEIVRSYSGTDNCGNIGYCFQNITVVDDVPPSIISAPENEIWVSCGTSVPSLQVSFSDNCTENLDIDQMSAISEPGCDQTISRSITATDLCGNSITFSQLVHIVDDVPPFILTAPESYSIACNTIIPSSAAPTFGDSCDEVLTVVENPEQVIELSCGEQIIRSWTATDDCGNSITAEQIITVTDNIAPQFGTFNPYIHIQCGELENLQAPSVSDNCNDVTLTFEDGLSSGGCYGVIVRNWIATDGCGNSTTAVQYISIIDNQGPVIENPADAIVDCDQAPTQIPDIAIYDACGYEVQVLVNEQTIVEIDECTYQIVWHWEAMDYCENISEATTTITVTDLTNPTIATLESKTFDCDAPYIAPSTPSYDDNCDEDLQLTFTQDTIPGICQYNYQIVYTWTVTDNCGNNASSSVTYTVQDVTNPSFDDSNEDVFTYACDIASVPLVEPIASDNCGDVTLSFLDTEFFDEGCTEGFVRVWTANDECGNSSNFNQYINLVDEVAPVIEGLLELNRPCDDYNGEYVVVTDNCNDFTLSHQDELVSGGCQGRVIRTYTATDDCNNSSTFVQIITLTDEVNPYVVNQTASQTFECGSIVAEPTIEFGDNCDEELSIVSSVEEVLGCENTVTYTWTATDNCGNSFTASTVYTFVDTTDPTIEAPLGGQFSCDEEIEYGQATADDSCSEVVSLTFVTDTITGGCPNEYVIVRTWSATDACGNIGTASASYYVFDNTAPSFDSVSETSFISCEDPLPQTLYTVSDNCEGEVDVEITEAIEEGDCPNEYSVIRTLTATDVCGNVETATHTIFVQDNTNPVITAEEVIEVACDGVTFTEGEPSLSDVTDLSYVVDARVRNGISGFEGVLFTPAVPSPGNATTQLDPSGAPVWLYGQNYNFQLQYEVATGATTWSIDFNRNDSYGDNEESVTTVSPSLAGQAFNYVNLWAQGGENGNAAQISSFEINGVDFGSFSSNSNAAVSQNFDNSGVPFGDITINGVFTFTGSTAQERPRIWVRLAGPTTPAPGIGGDAINQAFATASDNCEGDVELSYTDQFVAGDCQGQIIRTYTAEDVCGNTSTFVQTINIIDTIAPTVAPYATEITVECGQPVPAFNPVFDDNCDDALEIQGISNITAPGCEQTISRSFTATDNCGNSVTASQIVHIIDTTAPSWDSEGFETSMACGTAINLIAPTATDVCNEVTINSSYEVVEGECDAEFTEIFSYVAVDACGNASDTLRYIVHTFDNDAPDFIEVPSYQESSCLNFDGFEAPLVDDFCSEFNVTFVDTFENVEESGDGEDCGQFTAFSQGGWGAPNGTAAGIRDEYFDLAFPEGLVVGCDDNTITLTSAQAVENFLPAGGGSAVLNGSSINPTNVSNQLAAQLVAVSLAVGIDAVYEDFAPSEGFLGNAVYNNGPFEGFSISEVIDIANDVLGGCNDDYELNTVKDALESVITNYHGGTTDNENFSCGSESVCGTLITRTWTATDDCGNTSTASAQYFVIDDVAPLFNEEVTDVTVSCIADMPELLTLTANDACTEEPVAVVRTVNTIYETSCGNKLVEVFYTATDDCGNAAVTSYTITVNDNIAPEITADEEVELPCGSEASVVNTIYAAATDNCSDVNITFEDEFVGGNCEGHIVRIYTATDLCGNASTFIQHIVFVDTEAPTFAPYETEITVECGQPVPAFNPVFDDNCDEQLSIEGISSITPAGCEQTISRSFTATDNCGNSVTASQIVHIIDTTAPSWDSEGFETSITCGTAINLVAPIASDVCNEVTINPSYEFVAGDCESEYTEIFSYVAVDACGNASDTLRYIIHTFDNEAPEFVEIPENQTLSCPGELPSVLAVATDFCSDFEVTFVQDTIAGSCPSNYQIVRTFTATDDCGNVSESVTVTYTIIDDVAPQFETELSNVSIECYGEIVPVAVEVTDNCSTFEVDSEVIEVQTDDCGYGTFEVLYTATDACGNVNTASYLVTVSDTQDPILSGVPANIVLACDAEIPAPAVVSANDNCNGVLDVEFTETLVGDLPAEGSIADCRLLTPELAEGNPCNYPYDWAMALFGMPAAHRYYQVAEGNIARYPNGTAHVTATLVNAANANNGFNVDVWFGNEMDWSEWSSQSFPTSFKADCGGEDANYQDWLYFILQAGDGAELTGFGAYAGSAINLVHAPSNNYFGFQLGDGANNYNGADNGFGGWFTYSGSLMVDNIAMGQGGIVTGAGDFAFELDCCPRYEIVRCWTAYDCAGNVVSACQNISFEGSTITDAIQPNNGNSEEEIATDKGGITLSVFPNPANENATFTFSSALKGRGKLEVFDVTGAKVAELFNNNIVDNTEYRVDLNVSVLSRGIYTYRITNGIDTEVGRLIVTK